MNVYATVDELKLYLGGSKIVPLEDHKEDVLWKRFCVQASRMFDKFATNGVMPMRRFYPTLEARVFDYPNAHPSALVLSDDLLELNTLTTQNGTVVVPSADYILRHDGGAYNQTPYGVVQLHPNGSTVSFKYDGTKYGSQQVDGYWGFHVDWATAWEPSGDTVQDDPLSDSATIITVTDAGGDDINGLPHRFKNMQTLRIEDEIVWVIGINLTDNKLTVRRGMNGTTAAAHVKTSVISIYRPMDDVVEALVTLATHLYRRKDSIGTPDERPISGLQGQLVMPSVLPDEVRKILKPHRKEAL